MERLSLLEVYLSHFESASCMPSCFEFAKCMPSHNFFPVPFTIKSEWFFMIKSSLKRITLFSHFIDAVFSSTLNWKNIAPFGGKTWGLCIEKFTYISEIKMHFKFCSKTKVLFKCFSFTHFTHFYVSLWM